MGGDSTSACQRSNWYSSSVHADSRYSSKYRSGMWPRSYIVYTMGYREGMVFTRSQWFEAPGIQQFTAFRSPPQQQRQQQMAAGDAADVSYRCQILPSCALLRLVVPQHNMPRYSKTGSGFGSNGCNTPDRYHGGLTRYGMKDAKG